MRSKVNDHHKQLFPLNSIDDPILAVQPGGPVTFPLSSKRFVIEAVDETKPTWAGDFDNILPLLVPLEGIFGQSANTPLEIAVFKDLPHTKNSIYTIFGMSRH